MLHERKAANGMRDEFELRIDYGFGHGFELVTTEYTLSAIRVRWHGAIYVDVWHNAQIGLDCFRVTQTPWHGVGVTEVIAEGILGRLQDDEAGIDAFQKEV